MKNFPDPERRMIDAFAQVSNGLVYISETDAEVLPFIDGEADAVTKEAVLKAAGLPDDTRVEEVDFDQFFARLSAVKDWYGDEEKKRAGQFARLGEVLQGYLRELKVFRLGRVQ
ncbi:MAG TPA: nuclease A inhibitor family protein, partial [Pyrinomonadaceae bacterium]|nr:nuclease A inhibitor family protein [Pyrinomonadaceae bacterium]